MEFGGLGFLFALLLLFNGGPAHQDLLDLLPTQAYWQAQHITPDEAQLERDADPQKTVGDAKQFIADLNAKSYRARNQARQNLEVLGPAALDDLKAAENSKDPEVSAVARELFNRFSQFPKTQAVRQLMAIRTLGERHEQAALPLLKQLETSKTLFVAAYARRAEAQIQNLPPPGPEGVHDVVMDKSGLSSDLALFPADTGIIGQWFGLGSETLTLETVIDESIKQMAANGMAAGMGRNHKPSREEMLQRGTKQILTLAERVGNIRLDGITVAVSENAGENAGWFLLCLRGEYDKPAVIQAITSLLPNETEEATTQKSTREGNIDVIEIQPEWSLLLPSNNQLWVVGCDAHEDKGTLIKRVTEGINSGNGGMTQNAAMTQLIKTIDTNSPIWAVAQLNKEMRNEPLLAAFDTVTFAATNAKDKITFAFHGTGTDEKAVQVSADQMRADIQQVIGQIKPLIGRMAALEPAVALLESIKVTQTSTSAAMEGALDRAELKTLLGGAMPFLLMIGG